MSNWTRLKHSLLLLPLTTALLTGCMTFQVSEKQLLMPDKTITASNIAATAPGYQLRELQLTAADGIRLYGQLFTHPDARVSVLYFGGNNFRIQQSNRYLLEHYSKLGVNLMLVDHRGYGASEGDPSIETLFRDGVAAFDRIKQELPNQPVIVHGFSLGSFIAGHVAKQRPVDALILEGSATNAEDWADATTPFIAKPFISVEIEPKLLAINNKDNLTSLRAPVLIVVGENDSQTPPSLAKKLYAEATQARYRNYVEVPDLGHFSALRTTEFGKAFVALREQLSGVN
ncbi:MAG: alpha/beta hydrolase [Pseudomonadota bacterium]